jgi:CelD/BcsL family acetyltransferase involved in cellulose biosynthesis
MGDTEIFDYADFVVEPGREEAFVHALIDDLRRRGIVRLELNGLRPDSIGLTSFAPIVRSLGFKCRVEQEDVTVELRLPGTWEDYLHRLKSKQRHEVRRKFRRLYEGGRVRFNAWDPERNMDEAVDIFLRLFDANRRDKADFMTDDMAAYFRALIRALARVGLLRLFMLDIDDVTAAAVMCCDYRNRRYLYNNAYDEHYRRLNVGLLSKLLSLRDAIEGGIQVYDFLRGDEVYKIRLGGRPTPIYKCAVDLCG